MMLLVFVCAFVGRGMAFLGAGDATCEQTFPYLLLALLYLARKGKPRGGRPDANDTQLATRPTSLISSQGFFLYIIGWWWC